MRRREVIVDGVRVGGVEAPEYIQQGMENLIRGTIARVDEYVLEGSSREVVLASLGVIRQILENNPAYDQHKVVIFTDPESELVQDMFRLDMANRKSNKRVGQEKFIQALACYYLTEYQLLDARLLDSISLVEVANLEKDEDHRFPELIKKIRDGGEIGKNDWNKIKPEFEGVWGILGRNGVKAYQEGVWRGVFDMAQRIKDRLGKNVCKPDEYDDVAYEAIAKTLLVIEKLYLSKEGGVDVSDYCNWMVVAREEDIRNSYLRVMNSREGSVSEQEKGLITQVFVNGTVNEKDVWWPGSSWWEIDE